MERLRKDPYSIGVTDSKKNSAARSVSLHAPQMTEEVCQNCFGSGMQVVAGRGARPCSCRQQTSHSTLIARARLPRRFLNSHFTTYRVLNSSQEKALGAAIDLALKYPQVERGLLFSGTVGVGKTMLAVSILKALIERGFACKFYEFGSVVKEIQKTFNANSKETEWNVVQPLIQTEVLVLDEIGATKTSEFVLDTLGQIVNARYNAKRLTIFTTNYDDRPSDDFEETLEERIGARLRSRLREMCKTVRIEGTDFRRQMAGSSKSSKSASNSSKTS